MRTETPWATMWCDHMCKVHEKKTRVRCICLQALRHQIQVMDEDIVPTRVLPRGTLWQWLTNAKPRRPNTPATAQAARWWPRTSRRRHTWPVARRWKNRKPETTEEQDPELCWVEPCRSVQSSSRVKTVIDFRLFSTVTKAVDLQNSETAKHSWGLWSSKPCHLTAAALMEVLFHRCPAEYFDRFGIRQHHACCKLEWPLWPVCKLASECWCFAIVRVSTSCAFVQLRSEVSHLTKLVLSVSGLPSVPPRLRASELLPWLMSLGYCFVTGTVSRCGFVTSGFATTLEDVPLVYLLTTVPNSSSHSPCTRRNQQCIANDVFSTQQVTNRDREKSLAATHAQKEKALLPARALHTTFSTSPISRDWHDASCCWVSAEVLTVTIMSVQLWINVQLHYNLLETLRSSKTSSFKN